MSSSSDRDKQESRPAGREDWQRGTPMPPPHPLLQHTTNNSDGSPLNPTVGAIPRPARRTARPRGSGVAHQPETQYIPSYAFSPGQRTDDPPSPLHHQHRRDSAANSRTDDYSGEDDGEDNDSTVDPVDSVSDAASVLSTAMYRHDRGSRHFFDPQRYDDDDGRPTASSSLLTSNHHQGPSSRGGSSGEARRWPSAYPDLSFASEEGEEEEGDQSTGTSFESVLSYGDAPHPTVVNHGGAAAAAAASHSNPSSASSGVVYRPPGNRGYRIAASNEEVYSASSSPQQSPYRADSSASHHHHRHAGADPRDAAALISATESSSFTHSASSQRSTSRATSATTTTTAASAPSSSTQRSASAGGGGTTRKDRRRGSRNATTAAAAAGSSRRSHRSRSPLNGKHGSSSSSSNHGDGASPTPRPSFQMGLRRRGGRSSRNGSFRRGNSGDAADGTARASESSAAAEAAAGATSRTPHAPLSRRPVVSWRSHARVCAVTSVTAGQVLTGGDASGLIEVWDGRTGRLLCCLSGHQAPVLSLLTVPGTSLLLSGSADRTARLWELHTLQNTAVLEGHRGLITALATLWMPDVGLNLFTGSDDGTVRQWRAATGVCVHVYHSHLGPVNVVASLRPVKYIATGGSDGLLKLWNAQTLRCLSSVAAMPSRASAATTASASNTTATVAAADNGNSADHTNLHGYNGGVTEWSTWGSVNYNNNTTSNSGGAVWDIAQLSDNDEAIATATDDGAVRLWGSQWSQHPVLLKEMYLPGVLLKARSGARCLLACGTHLFVGGARGELYVWDTASLSYVNPPVHRDRDRRPNSASYRLPMPSGGSSGLAPHPPSAAAGDSGGDASGAESFDATFFFHTAAITGLTRQGAQLVSSSLDHTICRWDLHGLVPLEGDPAVNFLVENGMEMGLAFSAEHGWSSPFSWAMRPSSSASALVWEAEGSRGAVGVGGANRPGLASKLAGGAAGSPSPQLLLQQQQPSPLALLRNPKGFVDGTATAGGDAAVAREPTLVELSPVEAAAAYTELPLSFIVANIRSAAISPVDVRSITKALLLILYVVFFIVFYIVGLAPVIWQSNDITNGLFSQTATYPLPSFARPQTFVSITNTALLERWLMLMMDQIHSLSVPVAIVLPAVPSTGESAGEGGEGREDDISSGGSGSSDAGSDASASASSTSTDPQAKTTLVILPALPGGVVLLHHVRVRVKHVTNTSCRWNSHFVRPGVAAAQTATTGLPCYGALHRSTESREVLCPGSASEAADITGLPNTITVGCLGYNDNAGVSFQGLFGHYDTGGYVVNLPLFSTTSDSNVLYTPIEVMRRLRLVDDQRTRLVDAVLFTYHIHTHVFVRLHYTLEMPRGGAWMASTDTLPCPLYNYSTSMKTRTTLACVVIMLVLLIVLLGLELYDVVMSYYVGELLPYLLSLVVLMKLACFILGVCVVGYCWRWIAVSRAVSVTALLRASVPVTAASIDNLFTYATSTAYSREINQLNRVAAAFHSLITCAAVEAVLLFLIVTVTAGRLVTFMHIVNAAMRQIRVQLITAAAMMALLLVSFALAFHLLYGTRHYAYASMGRSLWHLLLYFAASQSVNADVVPPLVTDRRVTGRLLLLVFNYVYRLFCYVYFVALVVERVQAVARGTPLLSIRAMLVKWWYDVQYQVALTRQRAPGAATPDDARSSTQTALQQQQQQRRHAAAEKSSHPAKPQRHVSLASSFTTSGHRRVIIEHVWRQLRRIQQGQEAAQQRLPQQPSTANGVGAGRHATTTSISQFLDRQVDAAATGNAAIAGLAREGAGGGRHVRRVGRLSKSSNETAAAATTTTTTAASPTAFSRTEVTERENPAVGSLTEAPFVHLQLRLTDLLLLLSEEERTPFARNVLRHAWDSLAWMYHYHQQHTRAQFPEEERRRIRLEAGIHEARLRLEPLFTVVRGTQVRLEAHEARLRPLAKAVEGMATGEQ